MKLFEVVNYSSPRTKELDVESAIKILKEQCKSAIRRVIQEPIYRGVQSQYKPFTLGDMSNAEPRKTKDSKNYYTLWIDNSPAWEIFPKRSKSFICSNNLNTADSFRKGGTKPVLVIPYDNAKVGVCPNSDLWDSFSDNLPPNTDLSEFMKYCQRIFMLLGYSEPTTFNELKSITSKITEKVIVDAIIKKVTSSNDILSILMYLDPAHILSEKDVIDLNKDQLREHIKLKIDMEYDKTLSHTFDRILDPMRFKVYSGSNFKLKNDNQELFIEGNCVFINGHALNDESYNKLITEIPSLKQLLPNDR